MTTVDEARAALLAAIYTSGSYECDAMVDALIAVVRAESEGAPIRSADGLWAKFTAGEKLSYGVGYRRGRAESAETLAALREAAQDHGICSCAAMTGGEGPRPIGGGRFYHFQGCDDDPVLRAALADATPAERPFRGEYDILASKGAGIGDQVNDD